MDADPRVVVRPEAQAVVDHGPADAERGPPAVVPGDVRLGDVRQRRRDLEETEGRRQEAVVGKRDAVPGTAQPEGHQQRQISLVDGVGKTSGHDWSDPLPCTSATEPRYCPISTLLSTFAVMPRQVDRVDPVCGRPRAPMYCRFTAAVASPAFPCAVTQNWLVRM